MKQPSKPAGAVVAGKPEIDALVARGSTDPSAVRTLRCRTVAQGRFQQLNYIRDLPPQPVMEEEPESLLAETTAPNASEALLESTAEALFHMTSHVRPTLYIYIYMYV